MLVMSSSGGLVIKRVGITKMLHQRYRITIATAHADADNVFSRRNNLRNAQALSKKFRGE